jgi:hypothetical protein
MLILVCTPASWGVEMRAGIYFDGSGSMKGFFDDNGASIKDINSRLYTLLAGIHVQETSASVFVSSGDEVRMHSLEQYLHKPVWGSDTRLDLAFETAQDLDIILMISDNVQDAGEYGTSSTMSFYQMLEDNAVGTVLLVPLRFDFNGPLYFYKNRYPDRNNLVKALIRENPEAHITADSRKGRIYQVVNYQGKKALILYAIFKKGFAFEQQKAFAKRLQEAFGVLPLMVKPMDQGNFFLEGVAAKTEVTQSFNAFETLCGRGDGTSKIAVPRPNLELESPHSDIYRAVDDNSGPVYNLRPDHTHYRSHCSDSAKIFRFYTRMVNRSSTTVLGPPGEFVPCTDKIRMELKDLFFTIPRRWQPCFLKPDPIEAGVRPDYIPRLITPRGQGQEDHHRAAFVMGNWLRIPRLTPNIDMGKPLDMIAKMVKLAFCRQIPITVKGTLAVQVPPGHFSMDTAYGAQYFTRSAFDQERIYTPEDIVAYINISPSTLEYDFASIGLAVVPPVWVKVVVFSGFGVLIMIGLLAGVSVSRAVCLLFDDSKDEVLRVALVRPLATGEYVRDGRTVLWIKKHLISYYAYPGQGYHLSDMAEEVQASVQLTVGNAFQVIGPGMPNVIVEITSCSQAQAGCEVVTLKTRDDNIGDSSLEEGVDEFHDDESDPMDSTYKGDA